MDACRFQKTFLPPANEVWGKVIFLNLSVILFTGGGSASVHAGIPPGSRPSLGADTPRPDTPLGADTPPCAVHAGRYSQQVGSMHPTVMQSCYRPQHSCKGYIFTGVCVSTGGGVCLSACLDTTTTTPGADTTPPGADTPRSRHPPPPEQTPPQSRHPPPPEQTTPKQTPLPPEQTPSESRHSPPEADMSAAANGTHPTGMQSC